MEYILELLSGDIYLLVNGNVDCIGTNKTMVLFENSAGKQFICEKGEFKDRYKTIEESS